VTLVGVGCPTVHASTAAKPLFAWAGVSCFAMSSPYSTYSLLPLRAAIA